MQQIINFIKDCSLKYKLITTFVLLSCVPLTIVGIVTYSMSKSAIDEKINYYSTLSSIQLSSNIVSLFDNYINTVQQFNNEQSLNQAIKNTFDNNLSETEKRNAQLTLKTKISAIQGIRSDIVSIVFISAKNKIEGRFSDYWSQVDKNNLLELPYYKKAINNENIAIFITPEETNTLNNTNKNMMVAGKVSDLLGNLLGVVVIEISRKYLDQICNPHVIDSNDTSNNYTLIIDSNGSIITNKNDSLIGKNISELLVNNNKDFLTKDSTKFYSTYDNKNVLINSKKISPEGNFVLVNVVDLNYLYKESNNALIITIIVGTSFILFTILLGIIFSNIFTDPMINLMKLMKVVESGNFSVRSEITSKDEIGQLSYSFNKMISETEMMYNHLKQQIEEQNKQLENLTSSCKDSPINDNTDNKKIDINKIIEINKLLENKIAEKSNELKIKNQEIINSIKYAGIIQQSILPREDNIKKALKNHFVLWIPKDIVSGDIYWIEQLQDNIFVSVIDCTGHGVPGAFMTMTAITLLKRIINDCKTTNPSSVLMELNKLVRITLNHQISIKNSKSLLDLADDGMDVGLCCIVPKEKKLIFAGAKLSLYICKNGGLSLIKGDRQGIGYKTSKEDFIYKNHEIYFEGSEVFYLTTDGYADQFGGENYKKIGIKKFNELILSINNMSMEEQKNFLLEFFENYKGLNPQTDDITILGFTC